VRPSPDSSPESLGGLLSGWSPDSEASDSSEASYYSRDNSGEIFLPLPRRQQFQFRPAPQSTETITRNSFSALEQASRPTNPSEHVNAPRKRKPSYSSSETESQGDSISPAAGPRVDEAGAEGAASDSDQVGGQDSRASAALNAVAVAGNNHSNLQQQPTRTRHQDNKQGVDDDDDLPKSDDRDQPTARKNPKHYQHRTRRWLFIADPTPLGPNCQVRANYKFNFRGRGSTYLPWTLGDLNLRLA